MGFGVPCTGYWQAAESAPLVPCPQPAEGLYEAECGCGHTRLGLLCPVCATAPVMKGRFCKKCHDTDGHDCPLGPVTEVPLPG
jgi:hypothetical protein